MKRRTESTCWLCAVVVVLAFSAVAGENNGASVGTDPEENGKNGGPVFARRPTERSPLVRQNTNFALQMYCSQVRSHPKENFVFSPMSVTQGLSLLYAGSGGRTAQEMKTVMQLPGEPVSEELHDEIASLGSPGSGKGYTLSVANGLFLDKDKDVDKEYLRLLKRAYGAEPTTMDFGDDPEARRTEVNRWVEEATKGKITDLLPKGSVQDDTSMVLANALHFKADWAEVFNKELTKKARFYAGGKGNTTVEMMEVQSEFYHGSLREMGVQVLELQYAGGEFSMFVVLPIRQDGLVPVESEFCGLGSGNVGTILQVFEDRMTRRTVNVFLPRFSVRGDVSLHEMLPELGMESLFDVAAANLSRISADDDLYVQSGFHKAVIEVNEEGTEAAASTAKTLTVRAIPPVFTVDRPFLFYVRDNLNKAVILLGRMWDPESTT